MLYGYPSEWEARDAERRFTDAGYSVRWLGEQRAEKSGYVFTIDAVKTPSPHSENQTMRKPRSSLQQLVPDLGKRVPKRFRQGHYSTEDQHVLKKFPRAVIVLARAVGPDTLWSGEQPPVPDCFSSPALSRWYVREFERMNRLPHFYAPVEYVYGVRQR